MSTRELIFLGTSSQVPTRTRNHNAMFLLWDKLGILFDPGEGTQRQLLLAGISASRITHIAITHFHGDHCLGLAGVIQRLSLDNVKHPVTVMFPRSGQIFFERLRNASIFYDAATIVPKPLEDAGTGSLQEVMRFDGGTIFFQKLQHSVESYGYRVQEDDGRTMVPERLSQFGIKGPAVRELIQNGSLQVGDQLVSIDDVSVHRRGQAFALVMDTRPCEGARILARKADLLVCESTYLDSESVEAHDHFHMTARDAANLALSSEARQLAITHFSPRYTEMQEFLIQAKEVFPQVFVADDLRRIRIPGRE
jgi:ribonuclease Z